VLDNNPQLLFGRAKTLAKYLDPEEPLMPYGFFLRICIDPQSAEEERAARDHQERLGLLWRAVAEGRVSRDDWHRAGVEADVNGRGARVDRGRVMLPVHPSTVARSL
jgi:hypothetical protein